MFRHLCFIFLMAVSLIVRESAFAAVVDDSGDIGMQFRAISNCPADATIRSIFKDSKGFVWMGSDNCVYRFDGVHVVPFHPDLGNSDSVISVTDFSETPDGTVIVSTNVGLFRIDYTPDGEIRISPFLQEKIRGVKSLAVHPDGFLAIATDEALWCYRFVTGTLSRFKVNRDQLSVSNRPAAILSHESGVLMFTVNGEIYNIGKNSKISRILSDVKGFPIPTKVVSVGGRFYLATGSAGLWCVSQAEGARRLDYVNSNVITSLAKTVEGELFVGTDGEGIFEIDGSSGTLIRRISCGSKTKGSIGSNQIYSLMSDDDGRLWVGHYQHGADSRVIPKEGVEMHRVDTEDKAVRTVNQLNDKTMVVGTSAGILYLEAKGDRVIRTIESPTLRSNLVISSAIIGDTLFVGTYGGGLSLLKASDGSPLPNPGILPHSMDNSHIFSIANNPRNGSVWLGTSDGLWIWQNNELTRFSSENSVLPTGNVYFIFFDSSGKGWVATENGLAIWDPATSKLRTDCFPADFIHTAKVRQIYEGRNRILYFVLENGRLVASKVDMSEFKRPDLFENHNNMVRAVAEDKSGKLWIATNDGLLVWDSLNHLTTIGHGNGIPSTPFLHAVPAVTTNALWFANASGLLEINPEVLYRNMTPLPLRPTEIVADGVTIYDFVSSKDKPNEFSIKFDHYTRSVVIKLSTLDYNESDNSRYEYRIDDGEWMTIPSDFTIYLHGVKRGDTKVYVRPVDNDHPLTVITLSMPVNTSDIIWISLAVFLLSALGLFIWFKKKRDTQLKENRSRSASAAEGMESSDGSADEYDGGNRPKYATVELNKSECRVIEKRLEHLLREDKMYTNPFLRIGDVAKMAGITAHKLSFVLSQYLNVSFYDYVNRYRIEEFKRMVKSGEWSSLTLTAMSEKAGFSSRSSFFRCFKKLEGITPGEYISKVSK